LEDGESQLGIILTVGSHGQGDWSVPEINRDHEDNKSADEVASIERVDARIEHGDDEGKPTSLQCLCAV
jgi:hypothetical protein